MNKLISILIVGISAVVVLATIIKVGPANLAKRGPQAVLAVCYEDGSCDDSSVDPVTSSDSEPVAITQTGSTPIDNSGSEDVAITQTGSTPIDQVPAPAAPAAPIQSSPTVINAHGQCFGDHAWWVQDLSDGTTRQVQDFGRQPGECGVPASAPAAPASKTVVNTRTYGQCGGTVGLEGLDRFTQFEIVETTFSDGSKTFHNNGGRGDNPAACGTRPTQQAPAAPIQQVAPAPAAPAAVTNSPQSNSCANGSSINGSNINCSNNIGGSTTINQTQSGSPIQNTGAGTQNINTQPKEVLAAAQVSSTSAQPKVITQASSEVKELPKTGVPLFGWMLGGLAPLGLKVRKFGSSLKEGLNANSIWQMRQFSKS